MSSYDVIIVGSGSTGGSLAARLSEDPDRSVLVLEAGPVYSSADELPFDVVAPGSMGASVPGHPNNWGYLAEMRPGLSFPYARGKGLGGSSSINGAYFVRGLAEDFATWQKMGNDDWGFADVLPFYKRLETDKDFSGDVHGATGPIPVQREPADRLPAFTSAFEAGAAALGYAHDPDKNDPLPGGGYGPLPMNVADGRRVGTAIAYLIPAMTRPNLTVLGDTTVTRVLFEGTRAVGVAAVVDGRAVEFRGEEVVVSTGALRTPQVLMLSGIGPAGHLAEHGITPLVDLAGVGANLVDHPMTTTMWSADMHLPTMMDRGALAPVLHWNAGGVETEILPFVARASDMMDMGGDSPVLAMGQDPARHQAMIGIVLMQEDSRGAVTLVSGDPADMPVLRWNLLDQEADRVRMRAAVRTAHTLFGTDALRSIGASLDGLDDAVVEDDAVLDAFVYDRIVAGHPCGTARMGPADDPSTVVDQQLRVHGVQGLRVADTSIFPTIPSRGPSATAVMLGERAAELMSR